MICHGTSFFSSVLITASKYYKNLSELVYKYGTALSRAVNIVTMQGRLYFSGRGGMF